MNIKINTVREFAGFPGVNKILVDGVAVETGYHLSRKLTNTTEESAGLPGIFSYASSFLRDDLRVYVSFGSPLDFETYPLAKDYMLELCRRMLLVDREFETKYPVIKEGCSVDIAGPPSS